MNQIAVKLEITVSYMIAHTHDCSPRNIWKIY